MRVFTVLMILFFGLSAFANESYRRHAPDVDLHSLKSRDRAQFTKAADQLRLKQRSLAKQLKPKLAFENMNLISDNPAERPLYRRKPASQN